MGGFQGHHRSLPELSEPPWVNKPLLSDAVLVPNNRMVGGGGWEGELQPTGVRTLIPGSATC